MDVFLALAALAAAKDGHVTTCEGDFYFQGEILGQYAQIYTELWADGMVDVDGEAVLVTEKGLETASRWVEVSRDALEQITRRFEPDEDEDYA